jgi:hypothetical protein
MQENLKTALIWIVGILSKNRIPFYVSGGLAAMVYGSKRPVYDIDIEISDLDFDKLFLLVKNYAVYGPQRYRDDNFDILLITLEHDEQKIDISGNESDKIYNNKKGEWEAGGAISNIVEKEIFGLKIPIISRQDLVAYKRKIGRPSDLEDVAAIEDGF